MSNEVKDISALAAIPSIFGSQLLAKGSDGTIGFVSAEQVFTNWGWSYGIVDDIATLNSDGIFLIMEETQGTPPGAYKRGSIVLKFTWDENAAYHLYLEYQNGRLWFQNKLHGVWLPWKQIAFVSANSGGVKFTFPIHYAFCLILEKKGGLRDGREDRNSVKRHLKGYPDRCFGDKTHKGELRRNDSTGSISYSSGRSQVWVSSRNIRVRCPYSGSDRAIYGANIYSPQLDGMATFVSFQGGAQWGFQQMDCSAAILCDNSVLRVGKEVAA